MLVRYTGNAAPKSVSHPLPLAKPMVCSVEKDQAAAEGANRLWPYFANLPDMGSGFRQDGTAR